MVIGFPHHIKEVQFLEPVGKKEEDLSLLINSAKNSSFNSVKPP